MKPRVPMSSFNLTGTNCTISPPAPESASAHLHPAPTFVGDGADASNSNPANSFSLKPVNLAASEVPRGAAAFLSGILAAQRGGSRALEGEAVVAPVSRVTTANPGPGCLSNISAVHCAHRVARHPLAHFGSIQDRAGSDQRSESNESHNQIEKHFEISEPMVGVNTV